MICCTFSTDITSSIFSEEKIKEFFHITDIEKCISHDNVYYAICKNPI